MAQPTLGQIQEQMQSTLQSLYNLMTQAYKHEGEITNTASKRDARNLIEKLLNLAHLAPQLTVDVPQDIITYVQEGRNPDIYTREFVEFTMKNNQLLKGKQEAFAAFRDVLAREIAGAVPELKEEVRGVVERTGGVFEG